MNTRRFVVPFVVPLVAAVLLGSSGRSMAADSHHPAGTPRTGMHDQSMMGNPMMGGAMMNGCPMMGQLPPGNEKLAMQMHGEMMKAMGDIMFKYADRIQTPASK